MKEVIEQCQDSDDLKFYINDREVKKDELLSGVVVKNDSILECLKYIESYGLRRNYQTIERLSSIVNQVLTPVSWIGPSDSCVIVYGIVSFVGNRKDSQKSTWIKMLVVRMYQRDRNNPFQEISTIVDVWIRIHDDMSIDPKSFRKKALRVEARVTDLSSFQWIHAPLHIVASDGKCYERGRRGLNNYVE